MTAAPGPPDRIPLVILGEIYDLGVEAAGDVWPTPKMALSRLFERGATFLDAGGDLPPIQGTSPAELLDALNVSREDLFLVEALYLATRHAAYVLTTEGEAREQIWVGLADRHLEIRSKIVERRRAEEQLKRELKALGGTIVPLPEHEDLPMTDGDRPRKSRGMYENLFAGATTVDVELDVPATVLDAADRVIEAKDWAQEWGEHARLVVLTHGISLAFREREADAIDGDDEASVKSAQAEARRRLMGMEGRYSTLRRRLFELRHNNRILQWRIAALEVEAAGMRSRLDQFLIDRDRLEQAISDRRAAGAVPISEDAGQPKGGWRRRLGRWLGRGG